MYRAPWELAPHRVDVYACKSRCCALRFSTCMALWGMALSACSAVGGNRCDGGLLTGRRRVLGLVLSGQGGGGVPTKPPGTGGDPCLARATLILCSCLWIRTASQLAARWGGAAFASSSCRSEHRDVLSRSGPHSTDGGSEDCLSCVFRAFAGGPCTLPCSLLPALALLPGGGLFGIGSGGGADALLAATCVAPRPSARL